MPSTYSKPTSLESVVGLGDLHGPWAHPWFFSEHRCTVGGDGHISLTSGSQPRSRQPLQASSIVSHPVRKLHFKAEPFMFEIHTVARCRAAFASLPWKAPWPFSHLASASAAWYPRDARAPNHFCLMLGGNSHKPSNDLFPKATAVTVNACVPRRSPREHRGNLVFLFQGL